MIWLGAVAVGLVQLGGSVGATSNQPERKELDALAIVLVLLGPAALAVAIGWPPSRWPSPWWWPAVYIAVGYPYGPIFLSAVVALFPPSRPGTGGRPGCSPAAGYAGFVVAIGRRPAAGGTTASLKLAVVAGWLIVVLAVSEAVRLRRTQVDERRAGRAEERQRRRRGAAPALAQELHDVLAHNISLINVQASVALHLLDEQPEQARPALTDIKAASREALQELRGALDVLRQRRRRAAGAGAPAGRPRPLVARSRASGLDVAARRRRRRRRAAGRRRAGRLPHRPGGADQRHPPRPAPSSAHGHARATTTTA